MMIEPGDCRIMHDWDSSHTPALKDGKRVTRWFPLGATPRTAMEEAILHLVRLADPGPSLAGFEWWIQKIDEQGPLNFHVDKDESVASNEHYLLHPIWSSVFYVTAEGGGTLVTNQFSPKGNGYSPEIPTEGAWSFPTPNKFLRFNGTLLHGVLPPRGLKGKFAKERITFLVNFWHVRPKEPNCQLLKHEQVEGLKLLSEKDLKSLRDSYVKGAKPVPQGMKVMDVRKSSDEDMEEIKIDLPGNQFQHIRLPKEYPYKKGETLYLQYKKTKKVMRKIKEKEKKWAAKELKMAKKYRRAIKKHKAAQKEAEKEAKQRQEKKEAKAEKKRKKKEKKEKDEKQKQEAKEAEEKSKKKDKKKNKKKKKAAAAKKKAEEEEKAKAAAAAVARKGPPKGYDLYKSWFHALPPTLFDLMEQDCRTMHDWDSSHTPALKDGKRVTRWFPIDATPRTAMEEAILHLVKLADPGPTLVGFEWWIQKISEQGPLNFHVDKDESVASNEHYLLHPIWSSVFYVTAEGGGTLITNQFSPRGNGYSPVVPSEAAWSFPTPNKFLRFNGTLLHGVLPPRGLKGKFAKERITFLVNFWHVRPKEPNCQLLKHEQVEGLKLLSKKDLKKLRATYTKGLTPVSQAFKVMDIRKSSSEEMEEFKMELPGNQMQYIRLPKEYPYKNGETLHLQYKAKKKAYRLTKELETKLVSAQEEAEAAYQRALAGETPEDSEEDTTSSSSSTSASDNSSSTSNTDFSSSATASCGASSNGEEGSCDVDWGSLGGDQVERVGTLQERFDAAQAAKTKLKQEWKID